MKNSEKLAKVTSVEVYGNITRLILELKNEEHNRFIPGAIYLEPSSSDEVFQLHKLVEAKGLCLVIETYNSSSVLPEVGKEYFYRGWWLEEAYEAALDTKEQWEQRKYPDNSDHDHCLFTWVTIAAYTENNIAWYSAKYGWTTNSAYKDFIENDIYNLRRKDSV